MWNGERGGKREVEERERKGACIGGYRCNTFFLVFLFSFFSRVFVSG